MINNYIKVGFRSLIRNKISTFVNVIGLSLSMVVGVFIFAYLKSNWETDHFHPLRNKTFRITTFVVNKQSRTRWATSPQVLSSELKKLSFVDKTTTVRNGGNLRILAQQKEIPAEIVFAEPSFFEIFGFRLVNGNGKQALSDPNAVLLSEGMGKRLFGDLNAVGEVIKIDGWGTFTVGGVIEKPSLATHLSFEVMLPMRAADALEKRGLIASTLVDWRDYKNASTYVLTSSESDLDKLNGELKKMSNKSDNQINRYLFQAQSLESITPWNPEIQNDLQAGSSWTGMLTWLFLALALTLLAAFNYTAMSVARILSRAKEVGIRKTNGALGKQVFLQFVTESILLSMIALVIAYVIILVINKANVITPDSEINMFPDVHLVLILLLYTLLTGFVAGAIPAFVLSKFKPIDVLRNLKTIRFGRKVSLYKAIIVVQFSVTIMLMIFFVVLKDMGQNAQVSLISKLPDNVTIVDLKGKPAQRVRNEIEQLSQARKISFSSYLPVNNPSEKCTLRVANNDSEIILSSAFIDRNFIDIYNLKLAAGSNVPENDQTDSGLYAFVNESARRLLENRNKNKNDLVGEFVSVDSVNLQIMGVLSDDSFPAQEVAPTIFRFGKTNSNFISISGSGGSDKIIALSVKKIWKKNFPDDLPEIYSFKERNLTEYKTEMGKVNMSFGAVCCIVMFVSCLGIFGMANYAVQSSTLQIGIRKAFGASRKQVVMSVTKPFFAILIISGIIGIPLGWLSGNLLKTRFGADVDLGFWNLIIGFGIVLTVALIVVISQTFRSAYINPAKVLRGE